MKVVALSDTHWEDEQSAGFYCPYCKQTHTITVGEPLECSCGKKFSLFWNVEVREVKNG